MDSWIALYIDVQSMNPHNPYAFQSEFHWLPEPYSFCCLSDFCGGFSFVVGAPIYIDGSNDKQKSFRGHKAKAVLAGA